MMLWLQQVEVVLCGVPTAEHFWHISLFFDDEGSMENNRIA